MINMINSIAICILAVNCCICVIKYKKDKKELTKELKGLKNELEDIKKELENNKRSKL